MFKEKYINLQSVQHQTIKKYGQDLYYLKGWEKDMKKSFLSLEELSQDAFFDGKNLIEVWKDLRFDIS